jgi:hypothetical protein
MKLQEELAVLKSYIAEKKTKEAKELADRIRATYTSEEEMKTIDEFIASCLIEVSRKTEDLIQEAESLLIKSQLKEVSKIISMSYLSEKYFNKKRSWIYQKINGHVKNGKTVKFTPSEIETFNFALQDISKKIGSIAIH